MLPYQILSFTIQGKIQNSHIKMINITCLLQHRMINLNYLINHILYQIFKIILSKSSKNMKEFLIIQK